MDYRQDLRLYDSCLEDNVGLTQSNSGSGKCTGPNAGRRGVTAARVRCGPFVSIRVLRRASGPWIRTGRVQGGYPWVSVAEMPFATGGAAPTTPENVDTCEVCERPMSRRVVIKGTSGSGKSTVAAELARRLDVPWIELDALHHGPGWTAPTADAFQDRVRGAMDAAPDGWVIDGNYDGKLGDLVTAQADAIVWLDLPFAITFFRLSRRTFHRIHHRVELWNGNRETWRDALASRDSVLLWMIRVHRRHRREWPRRFDGDARVVRLRTGAEVQRWLDQQNERDTTGPQG